MVRALSFDDVLIAPCYSDILPSSIDISVDMGTFVLNMPFLSAAMDTVTDREMAIAMQRWGGMGVIHRNMSIQSQVACVKGIRVAAAVGPTGDFLERAIELEKAGVRYISIDSAHGDSLNVVNAVTSLKKALRIPVCAGNVVTEEGARRLLGQGANMIKVGVGPGSICTTRVVAGVGIPQITAIGNVKRAVEKHSRWSASEKVIIIADGGIRNSGDVVKALAAGASVVMLGNMLAATHESAGEKFEKDGQVYKRYRGMGSVGAMLAGSKDRYHTDKIVPEGVEASVLIKGDVQGVLAQLEGGLRSGMGYVGARNIEELHERAEFVEITNNGLIESHPHDVCSY